MVAQHIGLAVNRALHAAPAQRGKAFDGQNVMRIAIASAARTIRALSTLATRQPFRNRHGHRMIRARGQAGGQLAHFKRLRAIPHLPIDQRRRALR